MIVVLDVAIFIIFTWAVIRLKWYEKLVILDIRDGKMKIEDFSVLINDIPIPSLDYKNDPELLKAMIVTHLEDIIAQEPVVNEPEDDTIIPKHESDILSI